VILWRVIGVLALVGGATVIFAAIVLAGTIIQTVMP